MLQRRPRLSTGYQGTTKAERDGKTGPCTKPSAMRVAINPYASPKLKIHFYFQVEPILKCHSKRTVFNSYRSQSSHQCR